MYRGVIYAIGVLHEQHSADISRPLYLLHAYMYDKARTCRGYRRGIEGGGKLCVHVIDY